MDILYSGRDERCDEVGEADQREERAAAEAETLRGGKMRWMLKLEKG